MATRKVYPVSVLNRYVKMLFENDLTLSGIWVMGEISNFKRHSSGHLYFTLKDEEGAVSCVMFAQDARRLSFRPDNGSKVQVYGRISLYEKTGTYQLYARQMEEAGLGQLYQAYEALKKRLEAEGLFDPSHKKPIPAFPKTIGIITSPTGAAIRDICQIARRRFPGIQLILFPALVQGDGAARTLVQGLETLDRMEEVDTIILGRGGGSIEDLWPFNEEIVARAIYACHKPVISAVGHETDFTIADFVSDLRAPTPSAAAELAVPSVDLVITAMEDMTSSWRRALMSSYEKRKQEVENLSLRLNMHSPWMMVRDRLQEVELLGERRAQKMRQAVDTRKQALDVLSKSLELSSPLHPLGKGYAMILQEGKVVSGAGNIPVGSKVTIEMLDGSLIAKVEEKRVKE